MHVVEPDGPNVPLLYLTFFILKLYSFLILTINAHTNFESRLSQIDFTLFVDQSVLLLNL